MGWADLVNRVTEAAQTGASFGKGAVSGVKDGVVSMATGLKDIAVGGYNLATDPASRERAKKAAAAVADYGGKFVKDPATRSKAYEQAQQIVGHARDEFVAARNQAAREGKLSEFYGKVAGRAGFEVGAFVVPVAKLGSATRAAKAGDAVADVAKVMRGGGVLADAKAGPVIAKCPSGSVPLAGRAGNVGSSAGAAGLNLRARPTGVIFDGTVYRLESPNRVGTTFDIHAGNIAADHRYSAPGVGSIYGATSAETAFAEVDHYGVAAGRVSVSQNVSLGNVLDLTNPTVRGELNVKLEEIIGDSYKVTHQLGGFARANGYDGLLAPSARNIGGSNLVIFPKGSK